MTNTSFPHSAKDGAQDPLGRFFALALAAHVVAAGVVAAASFFLDLELFSRDEFEKTEIIQSSVRVDVVAMPKLTVQELKKATPSPPASDSADETPEAAEPASSSDVEYKTRSDAKKKKVELSSLLKNLSERKTEKARRRKRKGPALSAKELGALVMEGNKVSKGQALVGDSLKQAQGEFAEYVAAIPGHVRPHWKLPSYLIDKGLRARIRVYISENGKILRTEIYQSSGEQEFDRRALRALKKTETLPPPAKTIRSALAAGKVVLGFPL